MKVPDLKRTEIAEIASQWLQHNMIEGRTNEIKERSNQNKTGSLFIQFGKNTKGFRFWNQQHEKKKEETLKTTNEQYREMQAQRCHSLRPQQAVTSAFSSP